MRIGEKNIQKIFTGLSFLLLTYLLASCTWDGDLAKFTGEVCDKSIMPKECNCDENGTCQDYCNFNEEVGRCEEKYNCHYVSESKTTDDPSIIIPAHNKCSLGTVTFECTEGQIKCGGECISPERDTRYCGAKGNCVGADAGEVCSSTQICVGGQCKCQEGLVECGDTCINPMNDNKHCGAKSACNEADANSENYQGAECKSNETCRAGECLVTSCEDGLQLCPDPDNSGKNICINITGGDKDNCGACGFMCKSDRFPNADPVGCKEGKCQYACRTDFTNCGTPEAPICVNTAGMASNSQFCNTCENNCVALNQYCKDGNCETGSCTDGCPEITSCGNADAKCGSSCVDCASYDNAAEGACITSGANKGKCQISVCAQGYHLSGTEAGNSCVKNDDENCAPSNSAEAKDCTQSENKPSNASAVDCSEDGVCIATACNALFVLENGACVDKNCCAGKNVFDGVCVVGTNGTPSTCKFDQCLPGYHKENNSSGKVECKVNETTACAPPNVKVPDGLQIPKIGFPVNCKTLYTLNATELSEVNNPPSFPTDGVKCDSFGYCDVAQCPPKYHIERFNNDGTLWKNARSSLFAWHELCVANTNNSCAPPNSYLPINCAAALIGAEGVFCSDDGFCNCNTNDNFENKDSYFTFYNATKPVCVPGCALSTLPDNVRAASCEIWSGDYSPTHCMAGYRKTNGGNSCRANNQERMYDCGSARLADKVSPYNCRLYNSDPDDTRYCTEDGLCRTDECAEGWHIKPNRTSGCIQNSPTKCGLTSSTMEVDCSNYDGTQASCVNGICSQNLTNGKICNGVYPENCSNTSTCGISGAAFVCQ